jgi:asparagine synthase (glutamine-hydrolysing)
MRNQLLRDSDVFSMAHGVELRVPFVDRELLAALNEVPSAVRYRPHKDLLIAAVPEIPDWLRHNRKKGFAFPFEKWMRGGFAEMLTEACGGVPVVPATWYQVWAIAMLERAAGKIGRVA